MVNADIRSTVWDARALCKNSRVFKLTNVQAIQHVVDDVQNQSLCNVDNQLAPNGTHTTGNHVSGDNVVKHDGKENFMIEEVSQESRNEINMVEDFLIGHCSVGVCGKQWK